MLQYGRTTRAPLESLSEARAERTPGWCDRINMNHAIGGLTYAFILLFIVISLFMVDVQVFQAPDLSASGYNPRHCLADALPIRGSIYDRHGTLLVYSVRDPNAQCGYRRVYTQAAVNAGLAPLIGYYSFRYGASGLEAALTTSSTAPRAVNRKTPRASCAMSTSICCTNRPSATISYLTLDLNLQQDVMQLYPSREVGGQAEYGGVCQAPGFKSGWVGGGRRPEYGRDHLDGQPPVLRSQPHQ